MSAPPSSTSQHTTQDPQPQQPQPQRHLDAESHVKRNPHPNFLAVQASRPDWDESAQFHYTKTRNPGWQLGDGATNDNKGETNEKEKKHVEIDPYEDGRPAVFNYKLLISAIVPRPVGFIGTRSADGTTTNLAPFSYTQLINHDPPLFTIGFASPLSHAKDTLHNLLSTHCCSISILSDHILEAANATSINAPYGISEWSLSGLTPAPCTSIPCSRVQEAVFSVEAKLVSTQEFESRAEPGKKTGVLAVVEGVRFWVREDALNEERSLVDPMVLRPMSRLGGIAYGRTTEAVEIPRPEWAVEVERLREGGREGLVRGKVEGQ